MDELIRKPSEADEQTSELSPDLPGPQRVRSLSLGQLKFRRFMRKPTGVASAAILIAFILMAALARFLAPAHPDQGDIRNRLQPPSREFSLGTDQQGRDMLSRVIYGSRVALAVGSITVAIGLSVGGVLGAIAGYFRGWLDNLIMRTLDLLLALPYILLVVAIVSMLGASLRNAIIAIGITNVPHFARIVRSVIMAIREKEYVLAAESLGVSQLRILARHVLPNSLSPVIVTATLYFGRNVIAEATLSFLGLGVQPPTAAWGSMVAFGREYLMLHPHLALMPGIALMLFVYALNTLGDAVRDVLDPKIR